ncbi:MAG: Flp family type IVb pilin [Anaerolineae bacterium]|jgi:pilus assembly protein Flp/PilA|nr:Flp family type IVb pilin [Anaerolineae bacterium]
MLLQLYVYLQNMLRREEGQDLAEYALLIGLIALVVVAAVVLLGNELTGVFNRIADAVSGWPIGGGG